MDINLKCVFLSIKNILFQMLKNNFYHFYRPEVVFGHVDPGITSGKPVVKPVTPAGSYMTIVPFTPANGTNGIHRICTQTKDQSSRCAFCQFEEERNNTLKIITTDKTKCHGHFRGCSIEISDSLT